MTKTKPLLFSAPMVHALLDRLKTQTRRIVSFKYALTAAQKRAGFIAYPDAASWDVPLVRGRPRVLVPIRHPDDPKSIAPQDLAKNTLRCPYGPGDLLWVRETWRVARSQDAKRPSDLKPQPVHYEADATPIPPHGFGRKRPGIFMPRWASRLTLELTHVRMQRVQDISEADAIAEGVELRRAPAPPEGLERLRDCYVVGDSYGWTAREAYQGLINKLRDGAWDRNAWFWALTFKVHYANIDALPQAGKSA